MDKIQFFESADKRYIHSQIKMKVKEAIEKHYFAQECERICQLQLKEAEETEKQHLLQKLAKEAEAQKMLRCEDALRVFQVEKAKQDKAFADAMKLRLDLENCEEMRNAESKEILKETKICQLAQIEEKKKMRLYQKEEDCVWFEARKLLAGEEERQYNFEQSLRKQIEENDQNILKEQVRSSALMKRLEKEQRQEEVKLENEKLTLAERRIIKLEIETVKEKKRKQCEMLKEQLQESAARKLKLEREKLEFEKRYNEFIELETEREKRRVDEEKINFKKTTLDYLEFLQGHRQDAIYKKQLTDAEIAANQKDEIYAKMRYNKKIADKHVNR